MRTGLEDRSANDTLQKPAAAAAATDSRLQSQIPLIHVGTPMDTGDSRSTANVASSTVKFPSADTRHGVGLRTGRVDSTAVSTTDSSTPPSGTAESLRGPDVWQVCDAAGDQLRREDEATTRRSAAVDALLLDRHQPPDVVHDDSTQVRRASESPCHSPSESPCRSTSESPCNSASESPCCSPSESPCRSTSESPCRSASQSPCCSTSEDPASSRRRQQQSTAAASDALRQVLEKRINDRLSDTARNAQKQRQEKKQDRKAAKTLSAILLAFIVTWTPYNVFTVVRTFVPTWIDPTVYAIGGLLY